MRNADSGIRFSRRAVPPAGDPPQPETLQGWIAAQLRADLADPVRIEWRRNRHVVTVLRGIEITVHRRARRVEVRGRTHGECGPWCFGTLDLRCPLRGRAWATAWWAAVQTRLPMHLRQEAGALVEYEAADRVRDAAWKSGLLPQARTRVLDALQLDPGLLERTRQLCAGCTFDTGAFNLIWRCPRKTRERRAMAPELWPLYGLARQYGSVVPWQDAGAVRDVFMRRGLSHRGWATLCRNGLQGWWPLRASHEFRRDPVRVIVSWVNLLAGTGRRDVPPAALTAGFGDMGSMSRRSAQADAGTTAIIRAAWLRMDDMDAAARLRFASGSFRTVLGWWYAAGEPVSLPRNVRWHWLARAARSSRLPADCVSIPVPSFGDRACIDGCIVQPLATLGALRAAGLELHNCMVHADPEKQRLHGESIFMIGDAATGRALAMFTSAECVADEGVVTMLHAACNRPAPDVHWRVAREYLKRWASQRNG